MAAVARSLGATTRARLGLRVAAVAPKACGSGGDCFSWGAEGSRGHHRCGSRRRWCGRKEASPARPEFAQGAHRVAAMRRRRSATAAGGGGGSWASGAGRLGRPEVVAGGARKGAEAPRGGRKLSRWRPARTTTTGGRGRR